VRKWLGSRKQKNKKSNQMRTKTMILSTLLAGIGSVSVMAQTNVYSLNAVGYINVTLAPGFNMISCPLITSPDNTVGTILNNGTGSLTGSSVFFWYPSVGAYSEDNARAIGTSKGQTSNTNGWFDGGTNVAAPGVGFWFNNAASSNVTVTFVGAVPTGPITNTLVPGFNMVGSVVPMSGDLASNSISALTNFNVGDTVFTYNTATSAYVEYSSVSATSKAGGHGYDGEWTSAGDPVIPNVAQGFWYDAVSTVNWVENYSVSQ
jgi:hypothetical protein